MAPDTLQNLYITIKLTLTHNFEAIIEFIFWLFFLTKSLIKPTRYFILLSTGFLILLFNFQYNKHIVEGLKEQTLDSLVTQRQSYKTAFVVEKTFDKAIPFALPIIGWSNIISGFIIWAVSYKEKKVLKEK